MGERSFPEDDPRIPDPSEAQSRAEAAVGHMLANDPFSRWMGIELVAVRPGFCEIRMTAREEMANGFGIIHGGLVFAFADSALAFACNSHGKLALLLDATISYPAAVEIGDELIAVAEERTLGRKTGTYDVTVRKLDETVVALFRSTVYRTSRPMPPE